MHVQPYLQFSGQAEQAAEFYGTALGAKIEFMMRFKDSPDPHPPGMLPDGSENLVMHMSMKIGDTVIMATDGGVCNGSPGFQGFALTLTAADEAESRRVFAALSDGGQVRMPLSKTFFSPSFGVVVDRFGVSWNVIVDPE